MVKRLALVALALVLACPTDEEGGGSLGPSTSATIGVQGGTVKHPSGVELHFIAGALSRDATVTIREGDVPAALPGGITAAARAWDLSLAGATLSAPATLTVPLSAVEQQAAKGKVGLYRWDGQAWTYAGGTIKGATISAPLSKFSVWVTGTGSALHKPFEFINQGPEAAIIYPYRFALSHPELDAPIDTTVGTPVEVTPVPPPVQFYPQGGVCFCVQYWYVSHEVQLPSRWRWFQVGDCIPPQNQWTYSSSEMSSDIAPYPVVFDTGPTSYGQKDGTCGNGVTGGGGAGAGGFADGGSGPPVSLTGSWTLSLRCIGQTAIAMTITFDIAPSRGTFNASGSGTDYNGTPLTGVIAGSVDANNVVSGTVSISTGGTLGRVDSFSAALIADTGWVPFTVTSHTGYEKCSIEGRFVKQ